MAEIFAALCSCFQAEEKYQFLKQGAEFTKTTKGFISTTTETIFVQLIDFAPASKSLKWKVVSLMRRQWRWLWTAQMMRQQLCDWSCRE